MSPSNDRGQAIAMMAGVYGVDPLMLRDHFLKELIELGFAGIQNFPTVGLTDGLPPWDVP